MHVPCDPKYDTISSAKKQLSNIQYSKSIQLKWPPMFLSCSYTQQYNTNAHYSDMSLRWPQAELAVMSLSSPALRPKWCLFPYTSARRLTHRVPFGMLQSQAACYPWSLARGAEVEPIDSLVGRQQPWQDQTHTIHTLHITLRYGETERNASDWFNKMTFVHQTTYRG